MTSINYNSSKEIYQVSFWDKENKKRTFSKSMSNKKDAENFANSIDFEYYYNRKYLLPKGIAMTKHNNRFVVLLPHYKGGLKQHSQHKTLKEALESRKKIISYLCLD